MMPEIGGLPHDSAWDKQFGMRGETRLAECGLEKTLRPLTFFCKSHCTCDSMTKVPMRSLF